MIEHLPPGNPVQRQRHGPWGDPERLLREVESRLRELIATNRTLVHVVASVHKLTGVTIPDPQLLPIPGTARASARSHAIAAAEAEMAALADAELTALMHPA